MKKHHIALITVAIGLCIAVIPQIMHAYKPSRTWNPPATQQPLTTTSSVNPYQDAVDNPYQLTDESLDSFDQSYGQAPTPPNNVTITIEVSNSSTTVPVESDAESGTKE